MILPARLRVLAEQGVTKSAAARELGITRQHVWRMAKAYDIPFATQSVTKGSHTHGPGKKPVYRAGCDECRALMRTWSSNRRIRLNNQGEDT